MRAAKILMLAALVFISAGAVADTVVTFSNSGGTFCGGGGTCSSKGKFLQLTGSTLIQVKGTGGADDQTGSNIGTVTLTTGLTSGSLNATVKKPTLFAAGGHIDIHETSGASFVGTFTSATWQRQKVKGFEWTLSGAVTGTLTDTANPSGLQISGGTVQLTTISLSGNPFGPGKAGKIDLASGGTTFTIGTLVTPEPGTLALFGTGLVAVGVLAKRRNPKKTETIA